MELMTNKMTMSSKEIAELTGKRHDNVLADIRKMLAEINSPIKKGQYKDSTNRTLPMLLLDRDEVECLITGYSAKLRMAVIRRLRELENNNPAPVPQIPTNLPDALRLAADLAEENQQLAIERDEAIKTKALIGSKREATAMGKAGVLAKEVKKLKEQLDQSSQFSSVKRMEIIHKGKTFNWRELKKASIQLGLPINQIEDQNYGFVKTYHAEAWAMVYQLDISEGV
ncbi:MAG: Rha family transcriptional regulator [Wohlfahrtiimonas sp.]